MTQHINLFGLSGGKDSAALMIWALMESGYPKESLAFTFTDTGNEHQFTYDQIDLLQSFSMRHGGPLIQRIAPPRDFWELAFHKHRFPSARARFCTQELKIFPMRDWCEARKVFGISILSHSGVRAGESFDRSKLKERDVNGFLGVEEFRPLLFWTLKDVFEIHTKHGVPLNRLYAAGAKRVGCFPCIMSRKDEIRNIALNFPERIEKIDNEERRYEVAYGRPSSFFASDKTPARFRSKMYGEHSVNTIRDVVRWSMTGDKARGRWDDPTLFDGTPCGERIPMCESGFCE